ncbi:MULTISPECIES: transglutaminase family protein [unclassified Microbacterium]|uniref:transglutaminase family protein n=1 Tax=unclassified Microbacterium TaxID=2609290 RepID=UPI00214C0829|nr:MULTISPECIES: transglutaminase family protein [unclassified Microbacterium]MCR2810882.1 transglutaminase family protein [Microbacterium sp. zg.B185]WIM19715.1 transglutaminase family protein [Microbacterium sp. zg-B185]
MKYRVTHRTTYTYDDDVASSFGLAHLRPRELAWQQVTGRSVAIDPMPGDITDDVDCYGNVVSYFHVSAPHTRLTIDATSEVTVQPTDYDAVALSQPWEHSRPLVNPGISPRAWAATEFALESPKVRHVSAAHEYGASSLRPGRPIGEAVTDLMHRIKADFDYDKTATTVTSTVADVLDKRAGVCQDFAHVALACLRSHGIAARYVSGYLATRPAPGRPRVVGADASHAWVAAWLPGSDQWLAFDPTNDQWVSDRHVTVAWGRDYGDVPPVKGVIFTDAQNSTLRVSVDVAPVEETFPA